MNPRRFGFRFTRPYRVAGLPFGVVPRNAWADLDDQQFRVRFGPWKLRTPLENIAGWESTGGFAFIKTAGPPHLSLVDHGITFATNGDHAVCVHFHEPVRGLDPTGRLRHPGATLTVAEPDALTTELAQVTGPDEMR